MIIIKRRNFSLSFYKDFYLDRFDGYARCYYGSYRCLNEFREYLIKDNSIKKSKYRRINEQEFSSIRNDII